MYDKLFYNKILMILIFNNHCIGSIQFNKVLLKD